MPLWFSTAPQNQPPTDINLKFTQLHPLCNTLCAEVRPWCLLVNRSALKLLVRYGGSEGGHCLTLGGYGVLAPPRDLQGHSSTFQLGFVDQDGRESFGETHLQVRLSTSMCRRSNEVLFGKFSFEEHFPQIKREVSEAFDQEPNRKPSFLLIAWISK